MQIRRIEPVSTTRSTSTPAARTRKKILKVAAYARVSTDREEQSTSYKAQVDYYTNYIKSNPDWKFVKVYTDEGITGTSTKRRAGFNSMIEDSLSGKIDLILTKSVSRFARNTVDSISAIRALKDADVEVFFEKENLRTLDTKGELLLTIMSSLAQEESRSISENVKWGLRKNAADGKYTVNFSAFLGYDRGPNGELVVNQEQAVIVKRVYDEFLSGRSVSEIREGLMADGIPSPKGKPRWLNDQIQRMLINEKYKGDALIQKTYTSDYLSKKVVKNDGSVPMYYVTGGHEAIIDPIAWDAVQVEYRNRILSHENRVGKRLLSNRIRCSDCGSWFKPVDNRYLNGKRQTVLFCQHLYANRGIPSNGCHKVVYSEDAVLAALQKAFQEYYEMRDAVIQTAEEPLEANEEMSQEEIFELHHKQYYRQKCAAWLKSLDHAPEEITKELLDNYLDHGLAVDEKTIDFIFKNGTCIRVHV